MTSKTPVLEISEELPVLKSGLYLVATPIGNLEDITLRALRVLKSCDIIYCEDTRVSRKLLQKYGISKPLKTYHDHNASRVRPVIISQLRKGQSIALISDAGTPLISDPGYKLVQECYKNDLYITTLPGASSVLAGLLLSGMPTDQFLFAGFADSKKFADFVDTKATLIFFESAKRLLGTLKNMQKFFTNRSGAVVRELSKLYEEVKRGDLKTLITYYQTHGEPKGELVIILSPPEAQIIEKKDLDSLLVQALKHHRLRDACDWVAKTSGIPRKQVYQRALQIKNNED